MNAPFKTSTIVKATLAAMLLVLLMAASIHFIAVQIFRFKVSAANSHRPERTSLKPSSPRSVSTKAKRPDQSSFAALSQAGTNWIQQAPQDSKLPFYQLKMNPSDLKQMDRSPRSDDRYPGIFVAGGIVYDQVEVRYRGDWARNWRKKPMKIFFEKDKLFEGRHALNLNSGWRDPAFVRELLAYHVYETCGVPCSKVRMVRLNLNGAFRGLYVDVEQPDKAFLKRYDLEGATLFKAASKHRQSDERNLGGADAYAQHYEKETKKSEGFDELFQFCREMDQTTNTAEFFARRVDVEEYVNYLAAMALVQNWDCANKNHLMLHDGLGSMKWLVIPWDLDRTFGDHWHDYFTETRLPLLLGTRQFPSGTGWNRMMDRFLGEPTLRKRYLDRLAQLLETEFTPQKLFPILDRLESEIAAVAIIDRQHWGGANGVDLHDGIAQVKHYIEERRSFLMSELSNMRQTRPAITLDANR